MNLNDKIQNDLNQALKSKQEVEVSVLRMFINAIKNASIQKKDKLDEKEIIKVLRSEIKKHNESIEAFQKGQRADLVDKEKAELEVLKKYLPQEISDDDLKKIIIEVIEPTDSNNFGQVMGIVMKKISGQADGNRVSKLVKEQLEELKEK